MSTLTFPIMPLRALWRVLAALALAAILAVAGPAQPAAASCGGTTTVNNETQLNAAIAAFNAVNVGPCVFTIQLTADIPLTAETTLISNDTADVSLVIEGNGHTVDGQGKPGVRVFYIFLRTFVTMNEITVKGGNVGTLNSVGGAGILVLGAPDGVGGHLTLTNSTVTGNTTSNLVPSAGIGVGNNATLIARNSTISGNSSGTTGGGIGNSGSVTLDSVTITNNSAVWAGAGYATSTDTLTIRNSIIAGNTGSQDCVDNLGSVTDQGHNLIGSQNGCGFVDGVNGTIVGQPPNLGPLANNGGLTRTHLPIVGSPAIDAGNTTLTVDQRGVARPQGLVDDIGAVEVAVVAGTITIIKFAEPADDTPFNFSQTIDQFGNFTLKDPSDYFKIFSNVAPGQYTVTELAAGAGWDLTEIECVESVNPNSLVNVPARTANITLDPNEAVTCSFTNVKEGTIRIVKQAQPEGSTAFDFTLFGATSQDFTLVDNGTLSNTFESRKPVGTYTIQELAEPGWNLQNIVCTDQSAVISLPGRKATFTLQADETVTCTFSNVQVQPGTITIIKFAEPADDTPFRFSQTIDQTGNFTLQDPKRHVKTFTNVAPGQHRVVELAAAAGWDLTEIECVESVTQNSLVSVPLRTAEINLENGESVTCSFTNVKSGTIRIIKEAQPEGQTLFDFRLSGATSQDFSLVDNGSSSNTFESRKPVGTYTIQELAEPGWNLQNIVCTDQSAVISLPGRKATFTLQADETVTCTFSNTQVQPGTITIIKFAEPADDTPFTFRQTIDQTGDFTLKDPSDHFKTFSNVAPGQHRVIELAAAAGWDLTDIECVESVTQNSQVSVPFRTAEINLDNGESVTCSFTNVKSGTIRIVKQAQPEGPTLFDFRLTGATSQDVTLVDDGSSSNTFESRKPVGTYTIQELAEPGWKLDSIVCTDPNAVISVPGRKATFTLQADETVICTFSNTQVPPGTITIIKFADPADDTPFNFSQTIDQTGNFTLKDPSDHFKIFRNVAPGQYRVIELAAAAGWDLTDIECVESVNPNSLVSVQLRTAEINLEANESVTCSFTNVKSGTIRIVKQAQPEGLTSFDFTLFGATSQDFTLVDDGSSSNTFESRKPVGTYTIQELAEPGWKLDGIVCTDQSAVISLPGRKATFTLQADETVTCTFSNTQVEAGTITIIKFADPADDTPFNFSQTINQSGNFTLKDPSDFFKTFSGVAPGQYRVIELAAAAGWDLTDIECVESVDQNSQVSVPARAAEINLDEDEAVICIFANTARGNLTVVKRTQGGNGTFEFTSQTLTPNTFTLSTTNGTAQRLFANLTPGSYDVRETVPRGWKLANASCSDGSNPDRIAIGPGEKVTCTFVNRRTIPIPAISELGFSIMVLLMSAIQFWYWRRRRPDARNR